ncbi:MAG: TonB-dependent receptor [Taibaiella sp.]|nr:TonB-dependent receptor [Taibaiella sp.]
MKRLIYLLSMVLCASVCNAQQFTIKGTIADTLNNLGLPYSSVTLIRASDSIMETHTRANEQGAFALHTDSAGKYLIMVTFPNFADYIDIVKLKDEKVVDLGNITMLSRSHLLKEFVLTQNVAAIKIKGDTTEYMADSFKVGANATVEQLLRRLPGLEVDKNGNVVAQGEKVEKILVDGEEFFSDDPAVVIKGLQAKVVDKVQVFDKKSDQSAFTGIDDGQKTKTINLELKENMKRGFFGKVDAAGGTDGYFQNQGMINAFKGKQQISAFGIMANTGTVGLGWEDRDKFGSGSGTTMIGDEGQIYTTYTSDGSDPFQSWDGKYNGQGLPKVWTGGIHYANKWDEDKEHLSGNYRYAMQDLEATTNTLTQYVLPQNKGYFTQQSQVQMSTGQRHGIDGSYEWKMDSSSSIKLTFDAGTKNTQTSSFYTQRTFLPDSTDLNNNTRTITGNLVAQSVNADLIYRKKFAKKGRSLSIDVKENYNDSKNKGFLYSVNNLRMPDAVLGYRDSTYNVDQRKDNNSHTIALAGKINYTEPLSKVTFLELNYGLSTNNSTAENSSYNKPTGSTMYSVLDPLYSSNYSFDILNNSGGANLRWVYKKVNFSFGSDVADTRYNQHDIYKDTTYKYDYFNLYPKASFVYKFAKQTSFSFHYYGNTHQPTINQIQPLRQNTDPLNIAIGNPHLKQQFQNNFQLQFNDYKTLSGRYLWASSNFGFINDAISQAANTDSSGRRTYQYVNVNGNYSAWSYVGYGFRIKKLDLQMGVHANTSLNHVNSFVNNILNTSNYNSYSGGLRFNYYKDKKYSISFDPGVTYNDNHATISTYTSSYWSSNDELDASVQLPLKFEIGTNVDWRLRQKTSVFDQNNNVFIWDAYVSKKFLKNNELELRVYAHDILNQNLGYNRSGQDNYVSQQTYNTITRYGLINLIWNFTKTATGAAPAPEETIIIKK